MIRVLVLTGGSTPERTVALAGAKQVAAALRNVQSKAGASRFQVTVVDTTRGVLNETEERALLVDDVGEPPGLAELKRLAAQENLLRILELPEVSAADVVLPVLHGRDGEGGALQVLLEEVGARFVGSDSLGSTLAMDKDTSKRLMRDAGIPTAPWIRHDPSRPRSAESIVEELGLPFIVKPSRVGSTVGLTLVEQACEYDRALGVALQYDSEVLMEQFPARPRTYGGRPGNAGPASGRDPRPGRRV